MSSMHGESHTLVLQRLIQQPQLRCGSICRTESERDLALQYTSSLNQPRLILTVCIWEKLLSFRLDTANLTMALSYFQSITMAQIFFPCLKQGLVEALRFLQELRRLRTLTRSLDLLMEAAHKLLPGQQQAKLLLHYHPLTWRKSTFT